MRWLSRGELLTKEELEEIAENYTLSEHARLRIEERHSDIDIKEAILNPLLAYYNTDSSINIAINRYEYIVVAPFEYKIITFKEKSLNNIDIYTKRTLALMGKGRK